LPLIPDDFLVINSACLNGSKTYFAKPEARENLDFFTDSPCYSINISQIQKPADSVRPLIQAPSRPYVRYRTDATQ